jgi:hypothetical protein
MEFSTMMAIWTLGAKLTAPLTRLPFYVSRWLTVTLKWGSYSSHSLKPLKVGPAL